jgi:hypothetical protein
MITKPKRNGRRMRIVTRRARPPIRGRLIVVAGQCSKVGKTSLAVDLIKAFPKCDWTAVKMTPYTESGCPVNGKKCRCARGEHTFAIQTEKSRRGTSDTSRFLSAGARKAIWVQTKAGCFEDALKPLVSAIADAKDVIIESNAVMKYWQPDLIFLVLDPRIADFKASAHDVLRFADAFVFRSPYPGGSSRNRPAIPKSGRPKFLQAPGDALPLDLHEFVRHRFRTKRHLTG